MLIRARFWHSRQTVLLAPAGPPLRLEPIVKDRIFVGYSELAGALEVVSQNPWTARFEFQLIEGYKSGEVPSVRYARRARCTGCHQGEAPIFSDVPWSETTINEETSRRIHSRAELSEGRYLGFIATFDGTGENEGDSRGGRFAPLNTRRIDASVERATRLYPMRQMAWREACRLLGDHGAARCRRIIAEGLVAKTCGRTQAEAAVALGALAPQLADALRRNRPEGYAVATPKLSDFDPNSSEGGEATASGVDPARPRGSMTWSVAETVEALTGEDSLESELGIGTDGEGGIAQLICGKSDEERRLAFDAIEADSQADDYDSALGPTFNRDLILSRLADRLLGERLETILDDLGRGRPTLQEADALEFLENASDALQAFANYCGSCHASRDSFLAGDSVSDVTRNLCFPRTQPGTLSPTTEAVRAWRAEILDRLAWTAGIEPSARSMPPSGSTERQALADHLDLAQQMRTFLREMCD